MSATNNYEFTGMLLLLTATIRTLIATNQIAKEDLLADIGRQASSFSLPPEAISAVQALVQGMPDR